MQFWIKRRRRLLPLGSVHGFQQYRYPRVSQAWLDGTLNRSILPLCMLTRSSKELPVHNEGIDPRSWPCVECQKAENPDGVLEAVIYCLELGRFASGRQLELQTHVDGDSCYEHGH